MANDPILVLILLAQDFPARIPTFGYSSHRCATDDQKNRAATKAVGSLLLLQLTLIVSIHLPIWRVGNHHRRKQKNVCDQAVIT